MQPEGFISYDKGTAELYERRRWWLGLTLGDMFDKSCDLYPDKEALVGGEKRFTYCQLRRLVDNMAYRLLESGLRKGDAVLLQLPNWPEFVISYFALQKAGLTMVLLTVNHSVREIVHLAGLTQPKAWILPERYRKTEFIPLIHKVKEKTPSLESVILAAEEKRGGFLSFAELTVDADDDAIKEALDRARPDPKDVCQILPSGGTTGLPKGAPRTHNDYICNVEYKSRAWYMNVNDICIAATTVGHNLALLVCVTAPIFHGAKIVLLDSTYPQDFCQLAQEEKATCTGLVPTLISRIVNFEKLATYDLSSLKKIYVGAANSPPELVRSVEKKVNARYFNAFGMVEGPCSQTRHDDPFEVRCNSIGRPVCPYDDFRILDASGKPAPAGTEGELAARGPGIFTGYFRNPQANKESFTPDGFFRTGDLAVFDANGNFRITGRIKDIINRGGENIAARDVEDLISCHPKVEYVAVVGMPDKDLGEDICAYIKPVEGAELDYEGVVDHLKSIDAARTHHPKRIEIVYDMPLTAAGKADKKKLKKDIEEKLMSESR